MEAKIVEAKAVEAVELEAKAIDGETVAAKVEDATVSVVSLLAFSVGDTQLVSDADGCGSGTTSIAESAAP